MKPSVARKLDAILNPPGQERLPLVQAADRMRKVTYRQRKELEQKERDAALWLSDALRSNATADYYRDLIDRCAPVLGDAFRICDDGAISPEPLRSKLPDLVNDLAMRLSVAGTDSAAYWKGNDEAVAAVAGRWSEALSDPIPKAGAMSEPLESLYRRTEALRKTAAHASSTPRPRPHIPSLLVGTLIGLTLSAAVFA